MGWLGSSLGAIGEVIKIVPLFIQSGPVGTIAIPADPRQLVGSRCSWKAVVKSALTVSQPPSTYMVYAVCGGWVSSTSVVVGGCVAGQSLASWGGSVFVIERIRRRSRPD